MEITVKDLTYKKRDVIYYQDLDLNLTDNSIVGLIGNNRSLLLDLLSGSNTRFYGDISIDNIPVNKKNLLKVKRKVAYIHQDLDLSFYTLNVRDECLFNLEILGLDVKNNHINDYLTFLELDISILKRDIKDLSNLEKLKVLLLAKLITNPDLLLLDDIVGFLDYNAKKWLINVIRALKNRYHKKIIITSNDVDYLYRLVENVLIVKDGKLVAYGDALEIFCDVPLLEKHGLKVPDLVYFSYLAINKKNVKLLYHKDVRDLIKDVYKHV